MHESVENAIDEIDAAMFSGDTFHDDDNREELKKYIVRWNREIESIEGDDDEQ